VPFKPFFKKLFFSNLYVNILPSILIKNFRRVILMAVKACKDCGKDVSNSASVCPHCGVRVKPRYFVWGCLIFFLGSMAISGISCLGCLGAAGKAASEAQERQRVQEAAIMKKLRTAPIEEVSQMKIKEIFQFGTQHTEVARENALNDIKGSKIRWTGVVYEVKRNREGYSIQLATTQNDIGAFIRIKGHEDAQYIEALREGSRVSAVGLVDGMFMRHLNLEPAYLEH
jgi:hypothetical protein